MIIFEATTEQDEETNREIAAAAKQTAQIEVMLAHKFDPAVCDPTGWLMSEKLDGVRAVFDGKRLFTRNGNEIHAPQWFIDALPAMPLDGELWMGRGRFQETVGAVRKLVPNDDEWASITYQVFELPEADCKFSQVVNLSAESLHNNPVARVVQQHTCLGVAHLRAFCDTIVAEQGEGVMLRDPDSFYEPGRSEDLLKFKPVYTDEARVVGHEAGKGRNTGKCGALLCDYQGKVFRVGSGLNDELRENPPALGALITFQYGGLTDGGTPRFPTFVVVRDYE